MKFDNVVKIEEMFSNLYVYYYKDGIKCCDKVELENYFFVKEEDYLKSIDLIRKIPRNPKYPYEDPKIEYNFNSIYHEKLIKIIPNKFEFWKIRKLLWENNIKTYESKMSVVLKFLIENEVNFTRDRRIGLIDIETSFDDERRGLDTDNTPIPIEIITLYDYKEDKYFTFALDRNKELKENTIDNKQLFLFEKETDMILAFINKFKEFNYDWISGWNVENYDWKYLLNRCKLLGININLFSNFNGDKITECRSSEYQEGKYVYWDILIPGIDIVDLIEVMKKANAYSLKPSSFSLKSTVEWYLKDEKKFSFGNTLQENIDYNIQDVRLVKLLMDKYELKEFLLGIHLDMANGVPLKHCIHNSIVIMYKIKQMFPHIIIPDNLCKFEYENLFYDLKKYDVRIKAAKVITPTPGIFENVVLLDFKSLYPSLIRTFNLCPSTLMDDTDNNLNYNEIDDIEMDIGIYEGKSNKFNSIKNINVKKKFRTDIEGIYPQICKYLIDRRLIFQSKAREIEKISGNDNFEYKSYAYKSDNQKQVLNSIFGVGSFKNFELYSPYVAAAITSAGRKMISFVEQYAKSKGYITIFGDTDSLGVSIPKEVNEEEFTKELNEKIKEYIITNWPNTRDTYCLNFEYQKTLLKFAMKESKKRYFGIDKDDKFLVKGFPIVQHSYPFCAKTILTQVFLAFLHKVDSVEIKKNLVESKKEFKKLSPQEIGMSLRIDKDLEEYNTEVQHVNAAEYSNNFLGTNFKGDSVGKFIFVKNVGSQKYPFTEYVMLDEETVLPNEFKVDYDKMWNKLILMPLKTLEELKELNIPFIVSENKSLFEYT